MMLDEVQKCIMKLLDFS